MPEEWTVPGSWCNAGCPQGVAAPRRRTESARHINTRRANKEGNRIGMPGSLLSMGMATAAGAQANTGTEIAQANTEDEGGDSGKYGLAGLLGLLGLAGLLKRDRHDDHRAPANSGR